MILSIEMISVRGEKRVVVTSKQTNQGEVLQLTKSKLAVGAIPCEKTCEDETLGECIRSDFVL